MKYSRDIILDRLKEKSDLVTQCKYGDLDTVKQLIEAKPDNINIENKDGDTPLTAAIKHDNAKVIEYLLQHPKLALLENQNKVSALANKKYNQNHPIRSLIKKRIDGLKQEKSNAVETISVEPELPVNKSKRVRFGGPDTIHEYKIKQEFKKIIKKKNEVNADAAPTSSGSSDSGRLDNAPVVIKKNDFQDNNFQDNIKTIIKNQKIGGKSIKDFFTNTIGIEKNLISETLKKISVQIEKENKNPQINTIEIKNKLIQKLGDEVTNPNGMLYQSIAKPKRPILDVLLFFIGYKTSLDTTRYKKVQQALQTALQTERNHDQQNNDQSVNNGQERPESNSPYAKK